MLVEITRRSQRAPVLHRPPSLRPASRSSPPISPVIPSVGSSLSKVLHLRIQRRRVLRDCRTRFKTIACVRGALAFPQVVELLRRTRACVCVCVRTALLPSFSFLGPETRECVSAVARACWRCRCRCDESGAFDAKSFAGQHRETL